MIKGFHVIIIDVLERKESFEEHISYIKFDLTDFDNYDELIDKVKFLTKNLTCLINNAAFNPKIEGNKKGFCVLWCFGSR